MPRSPRTSASGSAAAKPSARRNELVQIAAELFAEQGYLRTSVRDISDRANILSGSLFHHFRSKEMILNDVVGPYFAQLMDRSRAVADADLPADEAIVQLITTTIELIDEGPLQARILQNEFQVLVETFPEFSAGFKEFDRLWLAVLRRGVREGVFRKDVDLQIAYRMIRGSLSNIMNWYRPRGPKAQNDIVSTYATVFLNGLRAT